MKQETKSVAKMLLIFLWVAVFFFVLAAVVTSFRILTVQGALSVWFCLSFVVALIGYFTARSGRWMIFALINLAIIGAIAFSAIASKGDPYAPTNFALVLAVAYAPMHLSVTMIVGGLYWFFRRKKPTQSSD